MKIREDNAMDGLEPFPYYSLFNGDLLGGVHEYRPHSITWGCS